MLDLPSTFDASGPDPLQTFLSRYWFLAALAAVIAAGVVLPWGGMALRATPYLLPLLTAGAIFASASGIEIRKVAEAAGDARSIAVGVGTTYLVAPLLAAVLALLLGPAIEGRGSDGHLFYEAVMIAAAQAGTIASAPALTLLARGNQALALLLTVTTNLLTVVATPLVLRVALGAIVSFPVAPMISRMILVILLPVILAQLVRRFVWEPVGKGRTLLRVASQGIILVFVYTGVSSAAAVDAAAEATLVARLFAVAALLHLSLLAFLATVSRALGIDEASRTALVFCGSQKTLPNAIYLWDRFFPTNPFGALAMVSYHVLQLVVDTLLVPRLTPRDSTRRTAGS